MEIDYSVIIRTTGKAQEKYCKLLESIKNLIPKPKEIIVVLPIGCDIPKDQLGMERFYFSKKGMVIQRMVGIEKCKTRYALICDDDIQFDSTFVQKLYKPIVKKIGRISVGPLYSFLPPLGVNAIVNTIIAGAVPTFFHKDRYISILSSTGFSYNRHLDLENKEFYETQSAAWTCFFAEISALKEIDFNDEIWLDSHGYSALDDQTMFYKAWLRNIKTIVVSDATYIHLDARTSTTKKNRNNVLFSMSYNKIVFWHRFIYLQKGIIGKIWSFSCLVYRIVWITILDIFSILRNRLSTQEFSWKMKGYFAAIQYLKSIEYKKLPPVC